MNIDWLVIGFAVLGMTAVLTRKNMTYKTQGVWLPLALVALAGAGIGYWAETSTNLTTLLQWGFAGGPLLKAGMTMLATGIVVGFAGMGWSGIKSGQYIS